MMQRQMLLELARSTLVAATLALAFLTTLTLPADARGGHHGLGRGLRGHGMSGGGRGMGGGAQSAGDRGHANDAYTKAASDEEDKLLNAKIKSICRGC